MKDARALLLAALPLFLLVPTACSNPAGIALSSRQLLSVTIAPTAGTAPGSNGQIQFVATGHYNTEPYTVTPLAASWGVNNPLNETVATTDQTGLATCKQGTSGTTAIEAWVQIMPSVCNVIDGAGRPGCGNIGGSAQLICQ